MFDVLMVALLLGSIAFLPMGYTLAGVLTVAAFLNGIWSIAPAEHSGVKTALLRGIIGVMSLVYGFGAALSFCYGLYPGNNAFHFYAGNWNMTITLSSGKYGSGLDAVHASIFLYALVPGLTGLLTALWARRFFRQQIAARTSTPWPAVSVTARAKV